MSTTLPLQVNMLTELKAQPVTADTQIMCPDIYAKLDGRGGFYRWDSASVTDEDMVAFNVVKSDWVPTGPGRWVRTFLREQMLPHGRLVRNGSTKTFYATGVTASDGTITVYLTLDGTAAGTPIFSSIAFNDAQAADSVANADNAIVSFPITQPEDSAFVFTKHGFTKSNAISGNAIALLLTTLYKPYLMVGAGRKVRVKVEGN